MDLPLSRNNTAVAEIPIINVDEGTGYLWHPPSATGMSQICDVSSLNALYKHGPPQ